MTSREYSKLAAREEKLWQLVQELERTDGDPTRPPRRDGKPSRTQAVRLRIAAKLKSILEDFSETA